MGHTEMIMKIILDNEGVPSKGIENGFTPEDVCEAEDVRNPSKDYYRGVQAAIHYVSNKLLKEYDIVLSGMGRSPTLYVIPKNETERKLLEFQAIGRSGVVAKIKKLAAIDNGKNRKLLIQSAERIEEIKEELENKEEVLSN